MDSNAIQIAVRPRPFHPEKEEPFLIRHHDQPFFLGDGNFANSPRKAITPGSLRQVIDVVDNRMLNFDTPEPGSETKRGQPGAKRYKNRQYIFDHVLPMNATQEDVFEKTALPLIDGVLTGFNATVFAYGATGCGKTHTISGNPTDAGVIIRTMGELFRRIEDSQDEYETFIELSMVEIYNEMIRDLLSDDYPACPQGGLKLLENEKERVTVDKVTLKRPKTVDEVMELVQLGNDRRSTSSTAMNAVSSRSHAVLQINVGRNSKGHEINMAESVVRQCMTSATLSIIDLAGSERAAATRNLGERMKEGANINKSLLALSSCITALCQRPVRGQKVHVPYRNSKLTRMLKFSLGGNCRTVMIVCISPSSKDLEDTHNTLVWADRAKSVSTKISRNTAGYDIRSRQYIETIAALNEDIKGLKAKIATLQAGNERVYAENRRKLGQEDCHRAVEQMSGVVNAAIGHILMGAGKRAGWDSAEMVVEALTHMLSKADADEHAESEIQLLKARIQEQNSRYRNDAETFNQLHKEASEKGHVDSALRSLEQRKFGDVTDPADVELVRVKVEMKRMEVEIKILETREKVYRETVRQNATAFATVVSALHQVSTGLHQHARTLQTSSGSELDEARQSLSLLAATSTSALSTLFAKASGGGLRSIPTVAELGHVPTSTIPSSSASVFITASPPGTTSKVNRAQLPRPARNRMSLQPSAGFPASAGRSAVMASPAGKRLLRENPAAPKSPLSPARRPHVAASPAKRPKLRQSVVPVPSVRPKQKVMRWKDQSGEGELEQLKVMTSDSSSGNLGSGDDGDVSGEWVDTVPELPVTTIRPPRSRLPRASLSVAAGPMSGFKSASSSKPTGLTGTSPPSASSSSSSASDKPLPAWKANRIQRQAFGSLSALGPLKTLDEELSSSSSPEIGSSRSMRSVGLGAPSRLPLSDRKEVPGANTSVNLPASSSSSGITSNLFKPTAASLGKQSGRAVSPPANVSGTTGPRPSILGTKLGRRVSSIGPLRHERTKARSSIAPGMGGGSQGQDATTAHAPGQSFSTASAESGPGQNALSGGAKRVFANDSAPSLNRRASTMNLSSTVGPTSMGIPSMTSGVGLSGIGGSLRGPRPSMSMAQLPKSRPGIPTFGLSAGDTSMRAPWRG